MADPYITVQEIKDKLTEVKFKQLVGTNLSEEEANKRAQIAVDSAIDTFNSYAGSRYQLPVPATPVVKTRLIALVVYDLIQDTQYQDEGIYKIRKDAYDEAMKFLRDVQKGNASIAGAELIDTDGDGFPDETSSSVSGATIFINAQPTWR